MKICPKCNSSYTDESLNFCLTDGATLVAEEALAEHISTDSWHDAETLYDHRLSGEQSSHQTIAGRTSPTLPNIHTGTTSFQTRKKISPVYPVLAVVAVAVLAAGAYFWFARESDKSVASVSTENKSATPDKPAVQLTAQQENLLKTEVSDLLNSWRESNEKKDVDAHIAHYSDVLKVYYGESNKDKNHVRADRLRAYQRYDTISIQLDKTKIVPDSTEAATVTFDKTWTMRNAQKTSTGSVQQELHVVKVGGKWLIDAEKDAKVYFINNRENEADTNANQTNAPANQPANSSNTKPAK